MSAPRATPRPRGASMPCPECDAPAYHRNTVKRDEGVYRLRQCVNGHRFRTLEHYTLRAPSSRRRPKLRLGRIRSAVDSLLTERDRLLLRQARRSASLADDLLAHVSSD